MDLTFNAEAEAFRDEVRDFIRANLPDDIRRKVASERMDVQRDDQQRWHRILYRRGWACPSWPLAYGGTGWTDQQLYLFERELALGDAPRPLIYGIQMLGPTLIAHGTEEQRQRFLPDMASGEVMWCQGFSEPNAGSDLAALQCKAERDGDSYVINGSKTWTSEGHIADWMFGLFRTDSSGRKQHGITLLMLDMKSPGITVRPILLFEGTHEVNQVFFDNVRIPVAQRLGEEDQGWTVGKYLLSLERFGTAEVSRSMASLARLKRLAARQISAGRPLIEDPAFADKIAEAEIELRAVEVTELRFLFGAGGSEGLGAEASMLKVRGTEAQQRILELAMEAMAYAAQAEVPAEPPADPIWGDNLGDGELAAAAEASRAYFNFRKTAIYSGSNEIQKNIIAKAVLGL